MQRPRQRPTQRPLNVVATLAVVAAVASPIATMAQAERTKAGTLTCDISGGIGLIITSHKDVTCMFTPSQPGPREVYVGGIDKFGLDLGATAGGEMALQPLSMQGQAGLNVAAGVAELTLRPAR